MRLTIELVPSSSWTNNVRSIITKKQWDIIKAKVSSKAYNICEICGGIGARHPVECHEIWSYDSKKLIQKLDGMIALCPDCHMVKHIGLAGIRGKTVQAIKHLMSVNKITNKEAEIYVAQAFEIWAERSKRKWTLDISLLKDYGINVEKIEENKKT